MGERSDYPWFRVVGGAELEQGDLLVGAPRFVIPPDATDAESEILLRRETVDAVVLTQSCDLAIRSDGDCEATDVLLCPFYFKRDLKSDRVFGKDEFWEEVRKGRRPYFHVLDACQLAGHEQDYALIDFHAIFTLSVPLIRNFAKAAGDRLRLLPPYREHLSQALARFYMRVGLPTDIPSFGKRK